MGGADYPTDFRLFRARHYLALTGIDRNAARVVWSDAEILEAAGDELTLLTPEISEQELTDDIARLTPLGAHVQAHLRVCD